MSEDWAPVGIDVDTPSTARMYDYFLGGKDNFPSDREAAERVLQVLPEAREAARENRKFLGRAVRLAAESGVEQFIDLGTGLPTQQNVHEVARRVVPDARVVYVDNDPVVLAHSRALLANDARTVVVQADVREPDTILHDPQVRELIDFDKPLGVLFVAVLHFVPDGEDPWGIVARFREVMAPGSHLIVSHGVASPATERAAEVYEEATSSGTGRDRAQIERFFEGFDLVDPGVVYGRHWRPEDGAASDDAGIGLAGVGRKA